ncbi:MAG TPA: dihydrodipicolinate synthase family protein [Candidatus Acidoferrales bacterium]|nr:dihydrodipicolinate synthase family protein [Candidatus Acidoferrales bacterium]
MTNQNGASGRRDFLQTMGLGLAGLALSHGARAAATAKPLRGLFPIGFTPFTPDDKIDLEGMAAQVKFSNRGGVHGFVWPQNASGWNTMSEKERLDGAEAALSAGKGGKTAIVIGVQGPDVDTVTRYAKHAEKLGADAIISLPPTNASDDKAVLAYYQEVGSITGLPFFAQAVGNFSVDLLVQMYKTIPTFRYVKDESGNPLERISEIRERTGDQLKVFSGGGANAMIVEMEKGFSGHCPYMDLADVFASAFDLFHKGQKREAFDMFGRIQAFASITPVSSVDIMIARGVFKPGTKLRTGAAAAGAGSGGRGGGGARARGQQMSIEEIRKELDAYLKPYLKA